MIMEEDFYCSDYESDDYKDFNDNLMSPYETFNPAKETFDAITDGEYGSYEDFLREYGSTDILYDSSGY